MPRRERKPTLDFAFDFLADRLSFVKIRNPPAITEGWTLRGTVQFLGKTMRSRGAAEPSMPATSSDGLVA